jgi:undecaprenyl-diphosphatase
MFGATILELHKGGSALSHGQSLNIAIGFVVSFVVAWIVIRQFLAVVARFGLAPFGWYRIAAGICLAAWLMLT